MTNYEQFQQYVSQLISLETEEKGSTAEKTITRLADQLHYLTQLEQSVTTKRLQIIEEFNQLQGKLKAKEVALHRMHKELKLQDKMTHNMQEQKELELQMKQLGTAIRQIEDLIKNIQSIEQGFVSLTKQEMSTRSFIAKKAEHKNDKRQKSDCHF